MTREEVQAVFDQQAANYDRQWARLAPLREGMHLLMDAVLSGLPASARILCVGSGTGAEIFHFAARFPQWSFVAVEPAAAMLEVCRRRAEESGVASRCVFHEGYLESLPPSEPFDAATSILVSQFILEPAARAEFFRSIACRLRPSGSLVSADLAADRASAAYPSLLGVWLRMMQAAEVDSEMIERMRLVYERDVAILPPDETGDVIASGGFEPPVRFFQGGLIHAWYSRRRSPDRAEVSTLLSC